MTAQLISEVLVNINHVSHCYVGCPANHTRCIPGMGYSDGVVEGGRVDHTKI